MVKEVRTKATVVHNIMLSFVDYYFFIQGSNTCVGYSGGPLVTQKTSGIYYQAGIVTENCAIYTRVSGFVDWITDNLEP